MKKKSCSSAKRTAYNEALLKFRNLFVYLFVYKAKIRNIITNQLGVNVFLKKQFKEFKNHLDWIRMQKKMFNKEKNAY